MRLQTFTVANPVAGNSVTIPIPLEPGMCSLIFGVAFGLTVAAAAQATVTIIETGIPVNQNLMVATNLLTGGAGVIQICGSLFCGMTECDVAGLQNVAVAQMVLPKYILQQNYAVQISAAALGGADTIVNVRIVAAYGTFDEIALL